MPTKVEIEVAAERLRREGMRVSVRNVRSALPRGGSYSDIGPTLAAWKVRAHYRPGKIPASVPAALSGPTDEFLGRLWSVARGEAEKVVESLMRERALLERVYEREAAAAWSEVDRLNEEVAALAARLARAGDPVAPGPAGPAPRARIEVPGRRVRRAGDADGSSAPRAPSRPRDAGVEALLAPLEADWRRGRDGPEAGARRFWDRLMREAATVIAASGKEALTAREVLDGLPDPLRREAAGFREDFDVAMLRRKMLVRVDAGRYFRSTDDGRFGLLPDGTSAPVVRAGRPGPVRRAADGEA